METAHRSEFTRISIDTRGSIDPASAGLCSGALTGTCHLMWALLVAVGWAQPLIDFMFRVHFIAPVYRITPFDVGSAALLVIITTVSGFLLGYVFAQLWNRLSGRFI